MKKIVLTIAIVLGSLTAINAQTEQKETTPAQQETPATDAFTEIKIEELPAAVTEALKKSYPDAVLSKAFVNDKKEYKLEISVKDQAATVYSDVNGNWIQK
ncbi:hypothetical protein [Flavobacterium flavipallidum]|uniref:Beta-lactamase-inhibitor-like, PepSY-like n=1 Tax=Flavobacterium flavipallidum TaxID=3139140 RepID=A0ABU9HMY9_9FLAO